MRRSAPLPLEPFRYYQYGRRTVHLDGCVEVASAYYSAPPGWIGRRVDVQWNDAHVRLLDPSTGQHLREHLRAPPTRRWVWRNHGGKDAMKVAQRACLVLCVFGCMAVASAAQTPVGALAVDERPTVET